MPRIVSFFCDKEPTSPRMARHLNEPRTMESRTGLLMPESLQAISDDRETTTISRRKLQLLCMVVSYGEYRVMSTVFIHKLKTYCFGETSQQTCKVITRNLFYRLHPRDRHSSRGIYHRSKLHVKRHSSL